MKQKKPITRQNFGGCVLVPQSYDITQGPIEISVVHLSTHSIYTPFGFVCIRLDTCGVICYSQHIVAKINNLWIFGNLLCAGKERERERERKRETQRKRGWLGRDKSRRRQREGECFGKVSRGNARRWRSTRTVVKWYSVDIWKAGARRAYEISLKAIWLYLAAIGFPRVPKAPRLRTAPRYLYFAKYTTWRKVVNPLRCASIRALLHALHAWETIVIDVYGVWKDSPRWAFDAIRLWTAKKYRVDRFGFQ